MNEVLLKLQDFLASVRMGWKLHTKLIINIFFYHVGHYFPEKVLMNIWNILYKITENDLCEESVKKEKSKKHLRCNIMDVY